MGAFKSKATIRIEGKPNWDDGEYIIIKGVINAEDMEVMSTTSTIMGENGKPQQKSSVSMVAALQCMIEDWCLYGDNDQPVPLYETQKGGRRRKRIETIAKLPVEYMLPVMTEIGALIEGSQVADPLDLPPSASEHTGELLHEMK